MFTAKRTNRMVTAWIAILAILCQVLVPALAQARPDSPADGLTEICTAFGVRTVSLSGGKPVPAPLQKLHVPHCAFCLSGPPAPPPSYDVAVSLLEASASTVPLVSTPSIKSRKLAAASPRGPPSFVS